MATKTLSTNFQHLGQGNKILVFETNFGILNHAGSPVLQAMESWVGPGNEATMQVGS